MAGTGGLGGSPWGKLGEVTPLVPHYLTPTLVTPLQNLQPDLSPTMLLHFTHQIHYSRHYLMTSLLLTEQFVHFVVLEYSRAFDSLQHSSVHENPDKLPLPYSLHNWLTAYF